MNYTQNYSMKLPGYGDNADIADLNENTTTIDGLIHANRTMIAQAYSQLESYVVGDIVENEGKLYRCIGATSGNWDSTKWTRTTLGDEVEESGASTLADLDDVNLTTPTEGQILTYNGDEWVNADALDVTKTASGNPIEVSDSASAPLVKCVSAITGYQEGSGTPSPDNIRPIVAYTEGKIEVRGKNALDPLKVKTGFQYNPSVGVQFTLTDIDDMTDNGDGTFSKTISGWYCFGYLFELPESECSFKIQYSGTGARVSYGFLDDSYVVLSSEYNSSTNQTITKSLAKTGTRKYFFFTATTNQTTADITFTEPQIEKGSTATAYEPYTSTTHTTTYPSAIYRGSEDVVNGEVDSSHLRFTVSSGVELYGNYGDDNAPLFYVDMPEYIITYPRAGYSDDVPISNFYNATTGSSVASMHDFEFRTETPPSGSSAKRVYIRDSRFTTAADFNTFIASNPIQFVFKLATEATSSVTPTNLPIKSLSGYSHIESSTGDMEIEYIAKSFSPITELVDSQISALQKMMELMLTSAREATMTASANYTAGTLIVACGALYKATTAISSGASLVVGTNITPTTIAAEIAALA